MRPIPLRDRVVAALRLAPMTAAQVARCLSASESATSGALYDLRASGEVVVAGGVRLTTRPRHVWRLA